MSDQPNAPKPVPADVESAKSTNEAAPDVRAEPTPEADTAAQLAEMAKRIETLEAEKRDLTDRFLRAVAEAENTRKRVEKEKADISKYAIGKFATDVIGLGDNLGMAIAAVPPDAVAADPSLKSLLDGVMMTDRVFVSTLEKHGVRRLDPKGELFNPHLHQAVQQRRDVNVPAGTIVVVLQHGYIIEDRLLRPAIVVVAEGGMKPVREPAPAPAPAAASPEPSHQDNPETPKQDGV